MATKVTKKRTIKDLKPNPGNPRTISDEKLESLRKALGEFGDLGGFVFNNRSEMFVGGHQRAKVFPPNAEIVVEKKYSKPTRTGTILEGYVVLSGERFKYREVDWDETKEKAAAIAANKGGGEWDMKLLSEWIREIDDFGFDLDLTLFDKDELSDLLVATVNPNFDAGSEEDQGKLDEKKKAVCPHCGESFTVAGRA